MKTISKKLVTLVLGEDDYRISKMDKERDINISGNTVYIPTTYGSSEINLDTFARLCKEWCLEQDEELMSGMRFGSWTCIDGNDMNTETSDTEVEAIIKATEWVAKEKGLI